MFGGLRARRNGLLHAGAAFALMLAAGPAGAQDAGLDIDITGTSLEELFGLDITSVSRKDEPYQETAAAIFVLTAEDIERSGATSVPEALRLVPGVQVSKVDASKWAVSIRGFHGRTSNKLLVMIDGRSVYNPLFAGVLWEARDVPLEDVERIEVVRGPGGSLWGANAVNGVINIITREAGETQGGLLVAGGGVGERAFGLLRHGWKLGGEAHGRVYARIVDRDEGYAADGAARDAWSMARAGFRFDWRPRPGRTLTFQGDAYAGEVGESDGAGGFQEVDHTGGNLSFAWERQGADVGRSVRVYYDRTDADNVALGEVRDTLDVDYQENRSPTPRHGLTWGLGYRFTADEIVNGTVLSVSPLERNDNLFSAFLQGEWAFPQRHARLQVGSKVERNDYTGTEVQPAVRFAWIPDERRTLWASVSRAVRTPSRLESDISAPFAGPTSPRAETLLAQEIGFRWRPRPSLAIDSTAFLNDYEDLLTLEGLQLGNELGGRTWGFESSLAVQFRPWCRLQAAYSHLVLDLHLDPDSVSATPPDQIEGADPRNQLAVRVFADAAGVAMDFDATVRFVDELPALDVGSYTVLDLRVGWRPNERTSLSLVGRNLLRGHHREQSGPTTTEVEPSLFLRLRLGF